MKRACQTSCKIKVSKEGGESKVGARGGGQDLNGGKYKLGAER